MKKFLQKYLEWITLAVVIVSVPIVWEMWRMPLKSYEPKEDITVIRERNCRRVMMTGAISCALWSMLLLGRRVIKGQARHRALRWIPLVLAGYLLSTCVRMIMAIQTYPWFYD